MNSPFDELFGKTPTLADIQHVFEEFDNQLGFDENMMEARKVAFQPWMLSAAHAIIPNIAVSVRAGQSVTQAIIIAICMGMLLGKRAVELGWDTSVIILDDTISKAEMDAFEVLRSRIVNDMMKEDGE